MFVLIYSATESSSAELVRAVLQAPVVREFLLQNFVLWAGRIGDADSRALNRWLNITQYPFVAALHLEDYWPNGDVHHPSSRGIVRSAEGEQGPDSLLQLLAEALQFRGHSSHTGETEREEQDREYRRVLEVESQKQLAEERKRALEEEEEEEGGGKEGGGKEGEEEREASGGEGEELAEDTSEPVPEEPPPSSDTVNVAIRLLDGQTVKRRFSQSSSVGEVLCFARSLSPRGLSLGLVTSFPTRRFSDPSLQLSQLGLGSQLLFHLERLDE